MLALLRLLRRPARLRVTQVEQGQRRHLAVLHHQQRGIDPAFDERLQQRFPLVQSERERFPRGPERREAGASSYNFV